jgi:L-rhamnose 1-dehydrogenase
VKLLEGKTVLVTGASAGIGRAIAIGAAQHGANVAVNYVRDTAGADSCLAAIEATGQRGLVVQGDVALPETATDFVSRALSVFGSVDVMVSNAGICPFHSFLDMPVETFERTQRVNMFGGYYMCQAAARAMVDQGRGGALVGGEFQTHYTPTKAGLHSLMQSAAIALGRHGIRCNSLLPGTILTDINRDDLADETKRSYMEGRIPLGRLGQPEDMVGPAVFLASDMARYVTGAALLVDGGAFVNLQ